MEKATGDIKVGLRNREAWPQRLLRWRGETVMVWTAITGLLVWLPSVRSVMEGSDYTWGLGPIGGRGLQEFLLPLPLAVALAVTLYGAYRRRGPFPWFVLSWNALMLAFLVPGFVADPGGVRFRGDTMGVDIPLGYAAIVGTGAMALLVLWWAWDMIREPQAAKPPLNKRNWMLLGIVVAIVPVQVFLLREGPQHGTTDQVGVLLTMTQYVVLNLAFAHARKELRA